jgi:hypothetical protein
VLWPARRASNLACKAGGSEGALVRWFNASVLRCCRQWTSSMLYVIPILLLGLFLYPYIPGHDLSVCAIKITTGIDCPGCGMIRSTSALLHGKFLESFRFHPLGIVVVGWMVYTWIGLMLNKLNKIVLPGLKAGTTIWLGKIFIGALFLVWIWRIIL